MGEFIFIIKWVGDCVIGVMMNVIGSLVIEFEKVGF